MNALSDILGQLPPASAYTVVVLAVLAESILLVGAFIPTLTLLLTVGALARAGHISLPVVIAAAAGAVVAGDFLAHRTRRFLGDQLRTGRVGGRIPGAAWHRAETLMTRHGGWAVLLARFLPMVRTLAPHFAGATRLPYHRIAPYSATADCLWATAEAGVGYAAATSLQRILTLGGPAVAVAILITIGVTLRSLPMARGAVLTGRVLADLVQTVLTHSSWPWSPSWSAGAPTPPSARCSPPSASCSPSVRGHLDRRTDRPLP